MTAKDLWSSVGEALLYSISANINGQEQPFLSTA